MPELSLALLKAGVLFVNYIQTPFPSYDFAIDTALFNGCSYFHCYTVYLFSEKLFIPEYDASAGEIVGTHLHTYFIARQNSYVVHSHLTGDGGQYFVPVFQFYLEHGIGKSFNNDAILLNECLFRHKFWDAKVGISPVRKKQFFSFLKALITNPLALACVNYIHRQRPCKFFYGQCSKIV
jgi:hypothetical protein